MFSLRLPATAVALLMLAAIAQPIAAQTPATQEAAPQESASPEAAPQDSAVPEQPAGEDGAAANDAPEATDAGSDSESSAAAGEEGENSETEPAAEAANTANTQEPEVRNLTVSTWGGAYGEALQNEVLTTFGTGRGVEIERVAADGKAAGDVAEMTAAALEAGCSSGELIEIDAASLAGAGADDFLAGSVKPCGAGSFVWSSVIAVNERAIKGGKDTASKATTLQNAFDIEAFPGRRAFIKSPRYILEMALIADGVAAEEVYQQLGSDEGVERALAKLDSLGDSLTWHASAKETQEQLAGGTAVFAQTFSGQAFFAAAFGAPIRPIWDGQVYSVNFWAIPANGNAQELAKEFVAHALDPERLAAVAEETGYGPARRSAVELTRQHPRTGIEMKSYLPTQPDNFARAVAFDEVWWSQNETRIEARFAEWLEAREPPPMLKPVRKPE